jgi:hypothetical protein
MGGGAVNITARESWESERLQQKKGPGDLRGKKKKPNKNTKTNLEEYQDMTICKKAHVRPNT